MHVHTQGPTGLQLPLGVTALEDKIVQRATVEVLNAIYGTDFLDFSYGFRPGRSQHDALDALYAGVLRGKVNWVLELDIRGFLDAIYDEWLVKFLEHRIADRRVVRLIQKWLNAGVLEDGQRTRTKYAGTPQGGSASPLLANVYLHYAFDLWVRAWGRKRARGEELWSGSPTTSCLDLSTKRMPSNAGRNGRNDGASSHWSCIPTRRGCWSLAVRRPENRQRRGQGKPETFYFLGLRIFAGRPRVGASR